MQTDFAEQLNTISKTRDEYLQEQNNIKEKEEQVRKQNREKELIEKQNECFRLIHNELLKMASEGLYENSNGRKKIVGKLVFYAPDDIYRNVYHDYVYHNYVEICTDYADKRHIDLDNDEMWFCIFKPYKYKSVTKKRFLFGTKNIEIPGNSELENFISNFNKYFNDVVKITGYTSYIEKKEYDSWGSTIKTMCRTYNFECCF